MNRFGDLEWLLSRARQRMGARRRTVLVGVAALGSLLAVGNAPAYAAGSAGDVLVYLPMTVKHAAMRDLVVVPTAIRRTATPTVSPSASRTATTALSPTSTAPPTLAPTPSTTPPPSITPTPSVTRAPSITPTPSRTPSPSVTPTRTSCPSPTPTPSPTVTATGASTPTPSVTPAPDFAIGWLHCEGRDEYVTVVNDGSASGNLSGWRIVSTEGDQRYTFASRTLAPGESVELHSAPDAPPTGGNKIRWTTSYIWNNDGDTAELRSPGGSLVDSDDC